MPRPRFLPAGERKISKGFTSPRSCAATANCAASCESREDMGGCQNYGPFLGTLNIRGRIIIGTQKGP